MVNGIPYRFRTARLGDFSPAVAQPAEAFVARALGPSQQVPIADLRGIEGLVIVGPTGVGKTHYMAAIAHELDGKEGRIFRSALAIVDEAKAAIQDGEGADYAAYGGVLMLDDLAGVRPTDFAVDVLARIIRIRYDEALPTVVTTHSAHADLAALYGAAVASRLLEFGPLVKLSGADRRART